jgi:thiamine-phosphate pyrophosphorylase
MTSLSDIARRLNLRGAGTLGARGRNANLLPPLILMTDPARMADPAAAVAELPRGSAVILRHYDDPDREALGRNLLKLTRPAGLRLLIAGDARLACRLGADGLHLPEWMARRGGARWRTWRRPGWLITAAAHSPAALCHARSAGADAALLSPVFATNSHLGAKVLGAVRFTAWCRRAPLAVYALGGITEETARRLVPGPAAGVGAIDGLKKTRA